MKKIKKFVFGAFFLSFTIAKAQLSGTLTVPGTYTSIAAAINDVNALGVGGPLTFNIASGYTEVAPIGGYTLTATGTFANPVIFQKSGVGANPIITAYAGGVGTPGSAFQDGVWRFIGSDYITIDGIDITDPNIANPDNMEFGYGLFPASATNGCQYNTIINCVITLNRENNANGTAPAVDGSRGIDVVNALTGAHTTILSITSASGSNSFNKFYSNTIQNCNIGISLIGFAGITPFLFSDYGNDIGGTSVGTGNIIRNFGGATLAVNPSAAIRTLGQRDINVSYNTINNNNGSGVNHVSTIRGIYLNTSVSANSAITNNTLTIKSGGTTSQVSIIENLAGATAASNSITITNNLITNCTNSLTTSGVFYGIYNNAASASTLTISDNTFSNNSSNATSGATYLIYNNGAVASALNITNNNLGYSFVGTVAYTGTMYNVYNTSGTILTTTNINNNNFTSYNHNVIGTGPIYFIYNTFGHSNLSINNNLWNSLTFNHSGAQYYMYNSSSTRSMLTVSSNSITNITRNAAAGTMYCYYAGSSSLPVSSQIFTNNLFSNITATLTGTGTFYGIYTSDGASSPYPKKTFNNNIISNINYNTTSTFYGLYASYLGDGTSASGSSIYSNKIDNITTSGTVYGLYNTSTASPTQPVSVYQNIISNITSNGSASSIYATYVLGGGAGTNFYKNKIFNITQRGATGSVYGIYASTSPTTTIYNNIVGNLDAPYTLGDSKVNGLYIAGGTIINAYFNSIYIPASSTSTASLFGSNAVYASTAPTVNLRNNIFVNLSVPVGTGLTAAYRRSSATLTTYANASNNNLFYAGVPTTNNVIFYDGTTSQQFLPSFQAIVTPRDVLSVTENPTFVSTVGGSGNFLNINSVIPTYIESGAQPIAGITDDYISLVRNITTPDIGAREGSFTAVPNCSGTPTSGTITGATGVCIGGNGTTLVLTGATYGPGTTYQWASSIVNGGPYTTLLGSQTTQSVNPVVSPTYYIVNVGCTFSGLTSTTAQYTVVINPLPTVVATPSVSLYCYPTGAPVSLVGSGASTYTWSPITGLLTFTGSTVNATPPSAQIYTLTATDVNGCVNTATTNVNVGINVNMDSVIVTPTIICAGGNSLLNAYSSVPSFSYCQATYATGTSSGDYLSYVSVNTLTNTTVGSSLPYFTLYPQTGATTTTLTAGNTYTLNFVAGTWSNNDIAAFIDYGQNGSLSDVGDKLGEFDNLAANPAAGSIVFTVPLTAMNGTSRFRVREMDHGTLNDITPCTVQSSFGETEDYSITIIGGVDNVVTYSWSPSTYLGATTGSSVSATSVSLTTAYTVSVTNSYGCISSATKTLTVSPSPTITVSSGVICIGNSYTMTPGGASTYTFSNGSAIVTPTTNTSYSVTGTSAFGCIGTNTAVSSVSVSAYPTVLATTSNSLICSGETALLTASTSATSYTWNTGATTMSVSVTPTVTSTYTVNVSNAAACVTSSTVMVTVNSCVGIKESVASLISVYPNPNSGIINISLTAELSKNTSVEVYDAIGKLVVKQSITNELSTINISNLDNGIYLFKIINNATIIKTGKLVKQ